LSIKNRVIICFALAAIFSSTPATIPPTTAVTEIVFHVYDKDGKRLNWKAFREKQEYYNGDKGDNDKLLEADDLTVILKKVNEGYGLYSSLERESADDGNPVIEWPTDKSRDKVSLSLAWPTADGYSNLILDLPNPSASATPLYPSSRLPIYTREGEQGASVIFNLLAAQQVFGDLETALAERARAPFSFAYTPSSNYAEQYTSSYNSAKADLERAKNMELSESERAMLGERAFEAAAKAMLIMLQDYGVQYARAKRMTHKPQWGVTFEQQSEERPINEDNFVSVKRLVNCEKDDGWVRIIFDRDRKPEDYKQMIGWAHKHGLKVIGELLDSFSMCCTSKDEWEKHVRTYVKALSNNRECPEHEVDVWEVGNEVNGKWLTEKISDEQGKCRSCRGSAKTADFITYAAEYVKKNTSKRTLLTLFWQIGEDEPDYSMFNWLKNKLVGAKAKDGTSVMVYLDDIGLSLYPDKAPMGLALDRVFKTLRQKYFTGATQRLLITELDYWPAYDTEQGYEHIWRWGAEELNQGNEAVRQEVRGQVAKLYQSAVLGYPYSGGGTYWWYYLQEATPPGSDYSNNAIWKSLRSVHSEVSGISCPP
jgi:hypothetical protein